MWKRILTLSSDKKEVIAVMPKDIPAETTLKKDGIIEVLIELGVKDYFIDQESIDIFMKLASEGKKEAFQGITVAKQLNAEVEVILEKDDMQANLLVKGAYGGRGLRGSEIVHALSKGHILKGINKLALKKVLSASVSLSPGEVFTQPVAVGKPAVNGKDARCEPLIEDVSSRVLVPQQKKGSEKLDMKDLGATVTVEEGDAVMRKFYATKGEPGFTVTGKVLDPTPGKDMELKPGKNTELSKDEPDVLVASISGLPIIKSNTVDIDNAMVLKSIGVETGHVKFKGSVVVTGNVEPGMIVRATGDIMIGGFIESADVQAQGDITVTKGIIGRTISDDEGPCCIVKSGQSISASYAQYSFLQAHNDINLHVHSMNNQIMCGRNLIVLEENEKGGTLSGRSAKVGGKVMCYNLGVEGDTATYLHAFAKFDAMKSKVIALKEKYDEMQNKTMDVVRKEIEFKKRKASERTKEEEAQILKEKEIRNREMLEVKTELGRATDELDEKLLTNIVDVKNHLYTHVTVQFGSEKILTKKEHGPTILSFNQHEIKATSKLESDDISSD
ncbi:DUF342 domain-containing protein [Vibrio salinus]|uniref:DUF342 domain-containing protein n=1 Tax=Vibrio salinus TaxID=2899784 RepID=UPI001E4132A9|nr:FapA family protein [Vibrio salinus]MCE0495129.1 FapA family protein [Vibrio salinus]